MKRVIALFGLLLGFVATAHAVTVPSTPLYGIDSNTSGPYTGNSTFTVVDQENVTSSLIIKNLTLTGSVLGIKP